MDDYCPSSVMSQCEKKNQSVIMDMWDFVQRKGYKKSALYYRILDMHKSGKITLTLGDLILISDLLGHKTLWATYKAQELGLIEES